MGTSFLPRDITHDMTCVAAESCVTFSFCVMFYCGGLDQAMSWMTTCMTTWHFEKVLVLKAVKTE